MNIIQLAEVDSTNNELKRLIANGAPEWTVISAAKQTHGRGRYDRTWESAQGNLFLSLLVCPKIIHSNIALVVGLAAIKAAKLFDKKSDFKLKWPNDIYKNGKKLGGILIEAEDNKIIIGIGVNIKSAPDYAEKLEANLESFCNAFLTEFKKYYEIWNKSGFKTLKSEWLNHSAYLHEKISIKLADREVSGIFKDITDDGEMMLENNGKELIISSGEIYGC